MGSYLEKKCGEALKNDGTDGDMEQTMAKKSEEEVIERKCWSLHEAIKKGDITSAKQMISTGSDINAIDAFGHPPFHYAIQGGHTECVALLLTSGANIKDYFKGRSSGLYR